MKYIIPEDSIDVLELSHRTYNCLRRAGIHTVGALLDYPSEQFHEIRNFGNKSISEIVDCLSSLKSGKGELSLVGVSPAEEMEDVVLSDEPKYPETAIYLDVNGSIIQDIPIEKMQLSNRATNGLLNNGYLYASQLVGKTDEDLLKIKNLGAKTITELIHAIANIKFIHLGSSDGTDEQESTAYGVSTIVNELITTYGGTENIWLKEVLAVTAKYPDLLAETLIYRLYEQDFVRIEAKSAILQMLENSEDELSRIHIACQMPKHLSNTTIIEQLLIELEVEGKISVGDAMVYRTYPTAIQYAYSLPEGSIKSVVIERIKGKTLQEIGESLGNLSRERIRQLMQKGLRNKPKLYEDKYIYIYEKYDFSQEQFTAAFDEPPETFYYLEMIGNRSANRKSIEELISDSTVSIKLRKKAEQIAYKNYLMIEGTLIKKTRLELIPYIIRAFCKDLTKYDQFVELYNDWLYDHGLESDTNLIIDFHTVRNRLQQDQNVLWHLGQSFRYYNYSEYDFDELINTLNLEQYDDIELSTLKFYRDFPDLMRSYDIRDEFELHNLLKKIYSDISTKIKFKKMPTIEFGEANRDEQVYSLLLQHSPISSEELGKKYEEAYGVKATTAQANYFKSFDRFFHNGIFKIDATDLPLPQFERMKAVLNNDFYSIDEVQRLYLREFPSENKTNINSYTLKTLGYRVYSGYVVRNTYLNAADYFRHLLTDDDIVDLRPVYQQFVYNQSFYTELYDYKSNRVIVEFAPLQFVNIRRLNKMNVNLSDIEDYCKAVKRFTVSGQYFTIYSLRKKGFHHKLDDLGFDDWFYASLLCEDKNNFAYRRMRNSKLFVCGTQDVRISKLLISIVSQEKKMDIFDLRTLLAENYDLNFTIDKLLEQIRETDLYYDSIMETVYIDYDTYFEEI